MFLVGATVPQCTGYVKHSVGYKNFIAAKCLARVESDFASGVFDALQRSVPSR
jgi:hypothetical protein